MKVFCWIFFFPIFVTQAADNFDLQGHRGARGLAPENTLPAFIQALKYGVNTLELDVVITKDKKVLVSHDLWINRDICLGKNGEPLKKKNIFKNRIYRMTYEEVRQYDCGSVLNPEFPHQKLESVHKPLLTEVFPEILQYIKTHNLGEVNFNVEIKSSTKSKGIFHPKQSAFSELVVSDLKQLGILEQTTIQSFDIKVLKYLRKTYPNIRLSYLVDNKKGVAKNLKRLGFLPEIYSPRYTLLSAEDIHLLHEQNIQVIPWTINLESDMLRFIEMGVDGLITDYPNKARGILDEIEN